MTTLVLLFRVYACKATSSSTDCELLQLSVIRLILTLLRPTFFRDDLAEKIPCGFVKYLDHCKQIFKTFLYPAEATLVSPANSGDELDLLALRNALNLLPDDQREALILVGAGGLAYEEAAEVCGCAVGTIKSRVSRARKAVAELLENNETGFSSDNNISAGEAFDDIMNQAAAISAANGT